MRHSVFYPPELRRKLEHNARKIPWVKRAKQEIISAAGYWARLSDEDLWEMMFGSTISRSWMVWSNGFCPSCHTSVTMYSWEIDPFGCPWKARCPHCKELFPKNDFYAFYRSGLDRHGILDPGLADRGLLFNVEHPDPGDPRRNFGVDDGEGYVEGGNRWRFIGAYLIYGQWKGLVLGGIEKLSEAHLASGDSRYAHKAAILLDRVADLYPTFDYSRQGYAYETPGADGYVSVWHDACEETRRIAMAYDRISEALSDDTELVRFLSRKAKGFGVDNPKSSSGDIQRNIEQRILLDALASEHKIHSNYPRREIAKLVIETVLGWPGNRVDVHREIDGILGEATRVDGVSGEKGLSGYATISPSAVSEVLSLYSRLGPEFLRDALGKHPRIHNAFRFHLDTWCQQKYYPTAGDAGAFATTSTEYRGSRFARESGVQPSMFSFFWSLYELTGDTAFVQVLYHANDDSTEGLPYDLFCEDPGSFQARVQQVIDAEGAVAPSVSANKEQWHLAILRSGRGEHARDVWIDYDAGDPSQPITSAGDRPSVFARHGHADGMNMGLFAKGLDLMPDFGYPPVAFGGWDTPEATWYRMSAAHNTVVVDGQDHRLAGGTTTLWADGDVFRAVRVSCPELVQGKQYERTIVMLDSSEADSVFIDLFRVVGGTDHAKFTHSHFAELTTHGLCLQPAEDYGHSALMRNFKKDPSPRPGWYADWKVWDRHGILQHDADIHLRYTGLTQAAEVQTCEKWIVAGGLSSDQEAWIPAVMERRTSNRCVESGFLASTFVAVIEPFEGEPLTRRISRLPLETPGGDAFPEANTAVEIQHADGCSDLVISADVENPLRALPALSNGHALVQRDRGVRLEGELGMIRRNRNGQIRRVVLCHASFLSVDDVEVRLREPTDFVEIGLREGNAFVASGNTKDVHRISIKGRDILSR